MLESVGADLRFAGRTLRKSPLVTIVAVVCISLGSGAVTTVFNAMNAMVLRPLPGVTDADRQVRIERKRHGSDDGISASYPYYEYLRDRSHTLHGMAAWGKVSLTIGSSGEIGTSIYGNFVNGSALGRTFGFRGEWVSIVGIARDARYASLSESTPALAYFLAVLAGQANTHSSHSVRSSDTRPRDPGPGSLDRCGASARRGDESEGVLRMIVREAMLLTAVGVAIGLALAVAATRLLVGFLVGVSPLDRVTYIAMSVIFVAATLVASWLPARRAAAADPMAVLREE